MYAYLAAQSHHFLVSIITILKMVRICALRAGKSFFLQTRNLIPAADGRVFGRQ